MLTGASGRHLSRLEKRPKMPHPTDLFALSIMQCGIKLNAAPKAFPNFSSEEYPQRFEQRGVAFLLAPSYDGLLVKRCSTLFELPFAASVVPHRRWASCCKTRQRPSCQTRSHAFLKSTKLRKSYFWWSKWSPTHSLEILFSRTPLWSEGSRLVSLTRSVTLVYNCVVC